MIKFSLIKPNQNQEIIFVDPNGKWRSGIYISKLVGVVSLDKLVKGYIPSFWKPVG